MLVVSVRAMRVGIGYAVCIATLNKEGNSPWVLAALGHSSPLCSQAHVCKMYKWDMGLGCWLLVFPN